jgi:GR25 family glycosyltransferase involved in LPS biosynthesis
MEKMMRRYNIKADIFPAYLKDNMDKQKLIDEGFITPDCTLNNGRICCHYSHMQVLKNFLDDPHSKNILVFEDDMDQKYSGSEQLNNIIKPYLENVPYGWNYLNLSGSYEDCDKTRPTDSPYWRNAYSILHRNAIAFDKNGARTVYNMCRPMKDKPGDVLISELIKNNYLGNSYYTTKQLFRQDRENWGTNLGNSEPKQPICDPRKKHK